MNRRSFLFLSFAALLAPGLASAQAKMPSSPMSATSVTTVAVPAAPLSPGPVLSPSAVALLPVPKGAQVPSPLSPASPASQGAPPAVPALTLDSTPPVPTDLDATAVRESAHLKTQIDLEKLRSALDQEQQNRLLAKKKFEDDLSGQDKKGASSSSSSPSGTAPQPVPVVQAPVFPHPYAKSVYAFGDRSYAQVVMNGATFLARPGKTLPNGAKVISVDDDGVVLRQHGHRVKVPVQSSSMIPYSTP